MNYIYIFFISLFIVIALYSSYKYYMYFINKQNNVQYIENNEFKNQKTIDNATVMLFYVDWCPHCKNTMDVWEEIKQSYNFNKIHLSFNAINCDDKDNKELVKSYKIKEYPTIYLVANNKKYYYDANLEKETFYKFLNAIYFK